MPEGVQVRNGKTLFLQSFEAAVKTWNANEQNAAQPTIQEAKTVIEGGQADFNGTVKRLYDVLKRAPEDVKQKFNSVGIVWGSVKDIIDCVPEYYGYSG